VTDAQMLIAVLLFLILLAILGGLVGVILGIIVLMVVVGFVVKKRDPNLSTTLIFFSVLLGIVAAAIMLMIS
jgi:hypothetical protein